MVDKVMNPITVSIVSHGQGAMIEPLLYDLSQCPQVVRIVLTLNIPEEEIRYPDSLAPYLQLIQNARPLGFGANHNQAFELCKTELFAVLNPDIRLKNDPFPKLMEALESDNIGVIAPVVLNPSGGVESSARKFPTLKLLLLKFIMGDESQISSKNISPYDVDWIAGMFLLFPTIEFKKCGGFDENFYLYYEDVDICLRLRRAGRRVIIHPGASVIHSAQRASRRNFRHLIWHITSMFRYFLKRSLHFLR